MRGVRRFFLFMVMIAAAVTALKLLNWMPMSMEQGGIRKYRTIDDVRTELGIKNIALPAYFPQHLRWPPSDIFAQVKPFPLVIIHFTDRDTGEIVLSVRQADSRDTAPLPLRLVQEHVDRQNSVTIKGRKALLMFGSCPDGMACNSITWQEQGFTYTVVEKGPTEELLKVAESMVSG